MADTYVNGQLVHDTSTTPKENTAKDSEFGGLPDEDIVMELKLRPFRRFFGEDQEVGTADEKINYVLKQINPEGTLSDTEIHAKLRKMETHIGAGELGEGRLRAIYRFVRTLEVVKSALLGQL